MRSMTCIRLALLVLVLGTTFASPALAAEYRDEVWSIAYHLQRARDLGLPLAPEVPLPLAILMGNPPPDTPDVRINNENDRHQSENSIAVSPLDNKVLLNSNNSTDWPGDAGLRHELVVFDERRADLVGKPERTGPVQQRRPRGGHRPEWQGVYRTSSTRAAGWESRSRRTWGLNWTNVPSA